LPLRSCVSTASLTSGTKREGSSDRQSQGDTDVKVHPLKSQQRLRKRLVLPVRPELAAESKSDLPATSTTAVTELHVAASQVDVALAAYFIAEKRGFEPGRELDDWLAAEAEITKSAEPSAVESMQPVGAGRM
jgi:Protein of unknown function (DUF2934)